MSKDEARLMPSNRTALSWGDQGPDNVGGRTRAILIDKVNDNAFLQGLYLVDYLFLIIEGVIGLKLMALLII